MKDVRGFARYAILLALGLGAIAILGTSVLLVAPLGQGPVVKPTLALKDAACRDQDDMCIWVHPTDPSLSTVITSDKAAGRLFVYDLAGRTLDSVEAPMPGNIDLRYGFVLGGRQVDIVACNERTDSRIRVYAIDVATRGLHRVDNDEIRTGPNYGGTLYRSPRTGKVYFVTTSGISQQYELFDEGTGKVGGRKVREWKTGTSEGAVGDDEAGKLYLAEEDRGVWEVGGEPDDPTPGTLVIPAGAHGLTPDVEGLTIYARPGLKGYLLVSSQGNSEFKVYRRGTCEYVGTFTLAGVRGTDGIDVTNAALGAAFPGGLFACHNNRRGQCPVMLTPWQDIARAMRPPLAVDRSWHPRRP